LFFITFWGGTGVQYYLYGGKEISSLCTLGFEKYENYPAGDKQRY